MIMLCCVFSRSVMSDPLRPHRLQPTRLLCPWGFSRQEYWRGLPWGSPGDLPSPGIKPSSPALQTDSLPSEPPFNSPCTSAPKSCYTLNLFRDLFKNYSWLKSQIFWALVVLRHDLGTVIFKSSDVILMCGKVQEPLVYGVVTIIFRLLCSMRLNYLTVVTKLEITETLCSTFSAQSPEPPYPPPCASITGSSSPDQWTKNVEMSDPLS